MDKKNLESAQMKAKARLARYRDKKPVDDGSEEFKREFVKGIMQDPTLMEYAMKNDPEGMSRLMKRYGLGGMNGTSA